MKILEVRNNVIHKSSPTPLLSKHANELITLSQLMNLVARGSVALSIRPSDQQRGEEPNLLEKWSQAADFLSGNFQLLSNVTGRRDVS